jgi:hypothetical protein
MNRAGERQLRVGVDRSLGNRFGNAQRQGLKVSEQIHIIEQEFSIDGEDLPPLV